jgi:glycosidase
MKICFNSRDINCKKPYGAVKSGACVSFNVTISNGAADCEGVNLIITRENFEPETIQGRKEENVYSFDWRSEHAGLYFYFFQAWSHGGGRERTEDYQLTVWDDEEHGRPGWLSSGLMYQIFPDRFARSGRYSAPLQNKNYTVHEKWGGLPVCGPDENGIVWNNDFFGGNLKGIIEKLDYLEELGVTVLYLNPVFEAFSTHRYDTGDYHKIDPMLGTEEDFSLLCSEAAGKGMRIVLDGVFNHTGADSVYFNKYGSYDSLGAYQSKDSPYYSWYSFVRWPDEYDCWWGINTLPHVNEKEGSYLDYIIRRPDSVVRHWLRAGASGLRLDVVDEIVDEFLDELRIAVKEENKDAMIIGEVWEDASNKMAYGQRRRYFQGKQLDSVMNYPLKDAIIGYLGYDHNAQGLNDTIESLRENYPAHTFNSLMNILGTHDTKRIMTVFAESSEDYYEARQKLFSALLIWAFMPGIPCIYYGDEIGMEGDRDPMNRQCFCPERQNEEITAYTKRLLNFRKKVKNINLMEYVPIQAAGGYFSFERRGGTGSIYVAINDQNDQVELTFSDDEVVDIVVSGRVDYLGDKTFKMHGKSGIAVLTSR